MILTAAAPTASSRLVSVQTQPANDHSLLTARRSVVKEFEATITTPLVRRNPAKRRFRTGSHFCRTSWYACSGQTCS